MNPIILADNLTKIFKIHAPPLNSSLLHTCKQFFYPRYQEIIAINKISISINKGERVAFIGPNGAGKSTTIKILASILYPTAGEVKVLGLTPWKNRRKLAYDIGIVLGQCSRLWYHLPVIDSFVLLSKMYDISTKSFQQRLNYLAKIFAINDLLLQTVKNLSLGQRIRCEIVASLLHKPKILFLDEPTIGLDVTAKAIVRDLLKDQSLTEETTLLLASHDTDDIETICDRVIIINKGKIIFNDTIVVLKNSYIKKKYINLSAIDPAITIQEHGATVIQSMPHKIRLEVDITKTTIQAVAMAVLQKYQINDLTIEDPSTEEIIKNIYAKIK